MIMEVIVCDEPRPWIRHAACVGLDPAMFFPGAARGRPVSITACQPAFSICAICPVSVDCLAWALGSGEKDGIYGGCLLRGGRIVRKAQFVQQHENASNWSSRKPQG